MPKSYNYGHPILSVLVLVWFSMRMALRGRKSNSNFVGNWMPLWLIFETCLS
jgi:hypothetical protein